MEKTLFAVYLGGKHHNGLLEDHDLIFVVATSKEEAKKLALKKTKIKDGLHADGAIAIHSVDGYSIKLIEEGKNENIG
ncbi:MAG: DUF1543 domain-containing protein [candidate division SR1 bacterium]|nr:DUF1543 domain-containing protein [candidate division SR1 bacterium]